MLSRFLTASACFVAHSIVANAAVTLNGTALPQADARPDVTVAIVEIREGGDAAIRLLPGVKRYGVSVVTKLPIPALEAELPINSTPARFSVGADGRTFRNCVVAGLVNDPLDGERLVYALRCEGVTVP